MKYIGVNGSLTPTAEAVISVMDHGFMYGLGLFETFRTYNGEPFLLRRHLDRLYLGLKELGIKANIEEARLRQHISRLLEANELQDGYVRLTVSAGEGPLALHTGDYGQPMIVVYVKPLPKMDPLLYVEGKMLWRLVTPRNTPEGVVRFKSLNYMNSFLAKRELDRLVAMSSVKRELVEGLQLTAGGFLAEGIVSNLFFIRNQTIYTPAVETGILPGITRSLVLDIARMLKISCVEGNYVWEELLDADEVFVTNSIQELVPITALAVSDKVMYSVGNRRIGPMTRMLLEQYRRYTVVPELRNI